MTRSLISAAVFAAALGTAGLAQAQMSSWTSDDPTARFNLNPSVTSDTTTRSILASPSCGAANPQGGIPSPVTWGQCP
jgi:hypothetical protein